MQQSKSTPFTAPSLLVPRHLGVSLLLVLASAVLIVVPAFVNVLWLLAWVALVPLFLALRGVSPKGAFLLGWLMEACVTWIAFYWLVGTMVRFGYIPLPLSLGFFIIIGLGNGIRLGIYAWLLRVTAVAASPWWYRLLLPPCAYVLLDYLYPRVFPWYLGVVQWDVSALIQIADVTGVHGITFLLVMGNAVVAALIPQATQPAAKGRHWMILVFCCLLLATLGYGHWRIPQIGQAIERAPTLRLGILQPNIGITEKGHRTYRDAHLRQQVDMSRATLAQQPDLIIWPETMYPYAVPVQAERLALPTLEAHPKTYWLIGAIIYDVEKHQPQQFNAALLVAPDTRILDRYDKRHLLAFGEYIPLQRYFPFLRNISPTIGELTAGTGGLVTLPDGTRIGPLICYEDILPALSRQAVQQGASVLINLTNNAWFGQTYAPYLHRLLAAFRAIENRVYLVRATNTGLTSIIDPFGREQTPLPMFQQQTLVQDIQRLHIPTVYTRFGNWFAQLCSVAAILLPLWRWWGKPQSRQVEQ